MRGLSVTEIKMMKLMSIPSVTGVTMPLLLLALLGVMLSLPMVTARVDYNCLFGEMVTETSEDGKPLQFCPTEMDPPVMPKGGFIWAVKDGQCYECICEELIGLACCECPRKRRRG